MTGIFSNLIENTMEVFIDDFFIYGGTFHLCLENLSKVLHRCEEVNVLLHLGKMPLHGSGKGGIEPCYL